MKEAASCTDAQSDRAAALDASHAPHASQTRRQQLSVKVTDEACRRFRRLADEQGVTLGALFELALEARQRLPEGGEACALLFNHRLRRTAHGARHRTL